MEIYTQKYIIEIYKPVKIFKIMINKILYRFLVISIPIKGYLKIFYGLLHLI